MNEIILQAFEDELEKIAVVNPKFLANPQNWGRLRQARKVQANASRTYAQAGPGGRKVYKALGRVGVKPQNRGQLMDIPDVVMDRSRQSVEKLQGAMGRLDGAMAKLRARRAS